jgi:hypothetical protein
MAKIPSAFDVSESTLRSKSRWQSWDDLASWLSSELDSAIGARSGRKEEIAYAWAYYEQQRMRGGNMPWPDAADLPSPFASEYTDAVHARLLQTIFVEPVWTVEGYGPSAVKAPIVEEFHQKAQEDERLQGYADEWILRGLIEGVGTLKVSESLEWRRESVEKQLTIQLDATGNPVMGAQGPMLAYDEQGGFVPAEDEQTPSALTRLDEWKPARLGPSYEVVPYLDFFVLPAHARHRQHIWGYASRCWRRWPELQDWAKRGFYSKKAVENVGDSNDKAITSDDIPSPSVSVVDQRGNTAQKELYEFTVLLDLDGLGERWWVLTLHKESTTLLRAKVDDGMTRYIRWQPFPKPGCADHGYSLVGHKLISVIEEDTARRNLKADRMSMKASQPIGRLQTAIWNPEEVPWGPRAVIPMRSRDDVFPIQGIEDVPQSIYHWGNELRSDADRLVGQNDTALGVDTEERKTLGEVQLRAGYSEVRINVIVKRMQESLEELGLARHEIWKRTLRSNAHLPPQRAMVIGLSAAGIEAEGYPDDVRVTAELLEGIYWFKPRGSVETADLNRQKQDLIGLLQTLGPLTQMNPAFAAVLGTIPAAKSIMEQVIRVFRFPDRQSLLGSESNNVFDLMQQQQQQQQEMQQMMLDPRMQVVMAMAGGGGGMRPQLPAGPAGPPAQDAGAVPQQVPAA